MIPYHILSNDINHDLEYLYGIKHRNIDQKFLYFDDNASEYYATAKGVPGYKADDMPTTDDTIEMMLQYISPNRSTAIIAIGCGASRSERVILSGLYKQKQSFTYFGVDSSKAMLQLSEQNLKDEPYESELVLADFTRRGFIEELDRITERFDERIFYFNDGTIGNLNQTSAIDSLYNVLHKNELIIMTITTRLTKRKEDDLKLFKYYMASLQNEDFKEFLYHPLRKIGIPRASTSLEIETFTEEPYGSLGARFSFEVKQPEAIMVKGEKIHLLEKERIRVVEVRSYFPEDFVKFVEGHDFSLQNQIVKPRRSMLAFRRF